MTAWLVTLDGEQKVVIMASSKSAARKRGLDYATDYVSVRRATPDEVSTHLVLHKAVSERAVKHPTAPIKYLP